MIINRKVLIKKNVKLAKREMMNVKLAKIVRLVKKGKKKNRVKLVIKEKKKKGFSNQFNRIINV